MARGEQLTDDRRNERRAALRAANRSQILDAAELVFGRDGVPNASMRAIADEAGYSSAAIYLFFENRQQLLADTLTRRADELIDLLEATIAAVPQPLAALHTIIDETLAFHSSRQNFWHMLNQVRTGLATVSDLGAYATDVRQRADKIEKLLSAVVRSGQKVGSIRNGDSRLITRMYMVLNNEYINMHLEEGTKVVAVQFHAIVNDALSPPANSTA